LKPYHNNKATWQNERGGERIACSTLAPNLEGVYVVNRSYKNQD